MIRVHVLLAVFIIMLILLGLYAKNVRASDMQDMFYEERITYLIAYGKPFPEGTPFKCSNAVLYKNRSVVRKSNGKAVNCSFKIMTRREYEDLDNVSRLF